MTTHPAVGVHHHHVVHGAIQKGPVVAYHHQGSGPVLAEVLDEAQGVEVQVVGGFVQQQHVGPRRQNH